jgi:hypothetical protein
VLSNAQSASWLSLPELFRVGRNLRGSASPDEYPWCQGMADLAVAGKRACGLQGYNSTGFQRTTSSARAFSSTDQLVYAPWCND